MSVKWVTARAKWTADAVFNALEEAVFDAVNEFNGMDDRKRRYCYVEGGPTVPGEFVVTRDCQSEHGKRFSLRFQKGLCSVRVGIEDMVDRGNVFQVVEAIPRLGREFSQLLYLDNNEPFSVEEFAQYILEDFFFLIDRTPRWAVPEERQPEQPAGQQDAS